MSTVQRIARNTTVLLVAQAASYLLAFVYMMYLARYLGAAGFGILSFALAFTGIFGVFTDFGLHPLMVREIARDKSLVPKYLANISLMKIILVTITFGLIALAINLMGYPEQTIRVVYLVALYVIVTAFTQMFYAVFQAFERMEYESLGRVLNSLLILCGVILAINNDFSVAGFASLFFFASVIILIYSFVILRWKITTPPLAWSPFKVEMDRRFWKSTLKEALPFGLSMTFVMIFFWVDSVMLSYMKGDAVVGWYNAAYRMVLVLLFIPTAFTAAIFPVMSKFYATSRSSLRSSYERFFKYMTILGIPIGVGTTLLAPRFIRLIFGVEYTNSILALQILVWSSVLIFMSVPFGNLFNSLNKQAIVTRITGACVILNVGLNLILIPRYSLIGASIATVSTQFLLLALCFVWSGKIKYNMPGKEVAGIITRVLISSVLMGLFIVPCHNLNLLALVPLAALLYFVILYLIRGVNKEDINLIRTSIKIK